MYHIFISYRRNDTEDMTVYIYDWLKRQLPHYYIFFDRDVMRPGDQFPNKIQQAIEESKTILVVIGPQWLSAKDEYERRRIDLEYDWVRKEIELALKQRDKKLIIPILLKGAKLPKADGLPPSLADLVELQKVDILSITDPKSSSHRSTTSQARSLLAMIRSISMVGR